MFNFLVKSSKWCALQCPYRFFFLFSFLQSYIRYFLYFGNRKALQSYAKRPLGSRDIQIFVFSFFSSFLKFKLEIERWNNYIMMWLA